MPVLSSLPFEESIIFGHEIQCFFPSIKKSYLLSLFWRDFARVESGVTVNNIVNTECSVIIQSLCSIYGNCADAATFFPFLLAHSTHHLDERERNGLPSYVNNGTQWLCVNLKFKHRIFLSSFPSGRDSGHTHELSRVSFLDDIAISLLCGGAYVSLKDRNEPLSIYKNIIFLTLCSMKQAKKIWWMDMLVLRCGFYYTFMIIILRHSHEHRGHLKWCKDVGVKGRDFY